MIIKKEVENMETMTPQETPPAKPKVSWKTRISYVLDQIEKLVVISFSLVAIFFLIGVLYFGFGLINDYNWKPIDDLTTLAKNVTCSGNNCTVQFLYNVSSYWQNAGTGSDVPVIGANDWIICLNGTEIIKSGNLRVGMIVATSYLHFIEEIKDGWITTRGSNTHASDPYRSPEESVNCVVGGVLR